MEKEKTYDEKQENKKDRTRLLYILSIIVIIIIFLVIFISGAYLKKQIFIDNIPKQPINNIKGIEGDPIAFVYTEDKTYGNYIYLINQFPISDEVGKSLEGQYKTFDFKLEFNENAVGINYEITLEKMPISDLYNDWVKVLLTSEEKGIKNCYRANGRIKTYNEYTKYSGKSDEVTLYKGTVTAEDVKREYREYRLRMWISEDVKVTNGIYESRTFVAKINIHATGII